MKNTLKYLQLWQKKRRELELNAAPQQDWQDMKRMLDEQMPTTGPQGGAGAFRAMRWWGIALVAGVVVLLYLMKSAPEPKVVQKSIARPQEQMSSDSVSSPELSDKTIVAYPPASIQTVIVADDQKRMNRPGFSAIAGQPEDNAVPTGLQPEDNSRISIDPAAPTAPLDTVRPPAFIKPTDTLTRATPVAGTEEGGKQRLDSAIQQKENRKSPPSRSRAGRINQTSRTKDQGNTGVFAGDWGGMIGTNLSSAGNTLFYGPFATLRAGRHWGLAAQVQFGAAQKLSGSYTHLYNGSRLTNLSQIVVSDSRKVHYIQAPIQLEYRTGGLLHFKAGPVISFPTRQANGRSILSPDSIRRDTAFYVKTVAAVNRTTYVKQLSYGLSAGIGLHYRRFLFDVAYIRRLSKLQVVSDLGGYHALNHSFQLSLGFQLNKP